MRPRSGGARAALLPITLLASGIVAGCSSEPAPPGAVTADEERQLNEAAAMLDTNSISLRDVQDNGTD